ncbi:uncharacterized protein LOC111260814 [Varroa jacobsoni]|uniref:uncharacterized protein LOC111260814 n=1 Tax=Varroa jacobsoni TaxID=62625 RepID=UPI000BF5AB16|nr:uncharacterized protein LOC111260814 [Varroa jacobsoni]
MTRGGLTLRSPASALGATQSSLPTPAAGGGWQPVPSSQLTLDSGVGVSISLTSAGWEGSGGAISSSSSSSSTRICCRSSESLTSVSSPIQDLGYRFKALGVEQPLSASHVIAEQIFQRHLSQGSAYPSGLPLSAMLAGAGDPSNGDANASICVGGCGGNGECLSGVCYCKVEFAGGTCQEPNLSFYIAFSTIFYTICAISFVQLAICIRCEFQRHHSSTSGTNRLTRALRLTTQKALYGLICVATALRGFYFSSPDNAELKWAKSLLSAYYPVLLTGSSLIVCLWAELFHVRDARLDPPGFLTKSLLGFMVFNFVTYALLFLEMVSSQYAGYHEAERALLFRIFNGSFAILMMIVVVVFLVYGVEVFIKIRGAFLTALGPHTEVSHVPDRSQQHQSRVGLVTYALLTLVTALFILSDMTGPLWKHRVALVSRNIYEVSFRLIEIGLALWFPCVLWNCVQPQQLWILNPKRLLMRKPTQIRSSAPEDLTRFSGDLGSVERLGPPECFICYDSDRRDAGPLIRPCNCRGDVSVVHHDCLKTWLVESAASSQCSRCKVCNEEYELERGEVWLPSGLSTMNWVQTCCVVALMGCSATAAILVVKLYTHIALRSLSVGLAVIVQYVCLRVLGVGVLAAYKRARFSAVRIISRKLTHGREASAALMAAAKEGPHSVAAAVKHELAAVHQNQKIQTQQQQPGSTVNTSM